MASRERPPMTDHLPIFNLPFEIRTLIFEDIVLTLSLEQSLQLRLVSKHIDEQICEAIAKVGRISQSNCYAPPWLIVKHLAAQIGPDESRLTGLALHFYRIARELASFEEDPQTARDLRRAAKVELCRLLVERHGRYKAVKLFQNDSYPYDCSESKTRDLYIAAIALNQPRSLLDSIGSWGDNPFAEGLLPSPISLLVASPDQRDLLNRFLAQGHGLPRSPGDPGHCHEGDHSLVCAGASSPWISANSKNFDATYSIQVGDRLGDICSILFETYFMYDIPHAVRFGSLQAVITILDEQSEGGWWQHRKLAMYKAVWFGKADIFTGLLCSPPHEFVDLDRPLVDRPLGSGLCFETRLSLEPVIPPLFLASRRGHSQLVRCLLSRGAKPYLAGYGHALRYAASGGYISVAKAFFDFEGDPKRSRLLIHNEEHKNSIKTAAVRGHSAFVEMLLERYGVPLEHREWGLPLRLIELNGYSGVRRILEAYGIPDEQTLYDI